MTDPSFTSLQVSVVGTMSKERGWGFYEKLRANDVMIVQGNQQVSDMLKRGERLIAVGALDSYAADLKTRRTPDQDALSATACSSIPSPTSVVKGSPNPNAAKLFAEFMIGDDAQKIFPTDGGYSARIDIAAPAGSPDLKSLKIIAGRRRLHRAGNAAHQAPLQRNFLREAAPSSVRARRFASCRRYVRQGEQLIGFRTRFLWADVRRPPRSHAGAC